MATRKIYLATASTEREAFIQCCQTCCPSNIVNISTAVRLLGANDNAESDSSVTMTTQSGVVDTLRTTAESFMKPCSQTSVMTGPLVTFNWIVDDKI